MNNIQQVEQHLKNIYSYQSGDFSRLGPAHKSPHYDDIVFRSTDEDGSGIFVKGFSNPGFKDGIAELEMINLFNSFSTQIGGLFVGPEIIKTIDQPFHFVMKECLNPIDFGLLSQEELMLLYERYRAEFDQFEIVSGGKITSSKIDDTILQGIQQIKTGKHNVSHIKEGIITHIKTIQQEAVTKRISNSKKIGLVEQIVPGLSDKVQQEFSKSFDQLSDIIFEYNFGRLRTGHVFGNQEEGYRLVDFDNVGYQIKGTELLGLIWSNTLCNCHNFSNYQSFKDSFDYWYQKLHHHIGNEHLTNHLTKMKLLGTIFADYGHLMYTEQQNRAIIEKLGHNIEEHNSQGIKWNYQLLCDYFPEFTV